MSQRPETDVRLDVGPASAHARPVDETTFHVALLGDFGGRGGDGPPPAGELRVVPVDRDDLDAALERLAPVIRLGGGATTARDATGGVEVRFRALDDFHPDRLVEAVPLFSAVRELAEAGGSPPERPGGRSTGAPPAPVEQMLSGSVLDRIVEGHEVSGSDAPEEDEDGPRRSRDPLRAWVDDVVRPYLVEASGPGDARLTARVEQLVADGIRELLREPAFRRLEALWRGVDVLVRRVETGARLTIHLVDVTRDELVADPSGAALEELLRRGAGPRAEPWRVLAATWSFGPSPDDVVLLRRMARLAHDAGSVVLAGGKPALAGLATLDDAGDRSAWGEPDRLWAAFRGEPEARSVGLALPRFLLRLPYGEESDPCDRVGLEEIPGAPERADYLWGSPTIPLVVILARAFRRAGPDLLDTVDPEVADLPLHVARVDGEPRATPCTEVALTRDDADRLLDGGLMPFAWERGSDRIRLLRLQSAAAPPSGLRLAPGR